MQVFMICIVHNPFGICGEKKKKQARKKEITGANTEKTTT